MCCIDPHSDAVLICPSACSDALPRVPLHRWLHKWDFWGGAGGGGVYYLETGASELRAEGLHALDY